MRVRLLQAWTADQLTLTARSASWPDRAVAEVPSAGLGLRGLSERVALVGGRLDARAEDGGFVLRAELPLRLPRIDGGLR